MSGENDGQTDIEHRKTNLRLNHAEMQAAKQQDRETTESTPQELWETADSTSRRPNIDEISSSCWRPSHARSPMRSQFLI